MADSDKKRFSVLYVDDEPSNLNIFKNTFRRDYRVFLAKDAEEGLAILEKEDIDLILSDQRMPKLTGVEFLKKAIEKHPDPCRILVTGFTDFEALKDAVNDARIFQYIQKPWDETTLRETMSEALETYDLKRKNDELQSQLSETNRRLAEIAQELIDTDHLKNEFLKTISHEIRTPLNGLKGSIQIFRLELEKEQARRYDKLLQILEISTARLEQFLLVAERITIFKAQRHKLEECHFSVKTLIEIATAPLSEKLEAKHLRLIINDPETDTFCGDEELIATSIREVLDNAIIHSPEESTIGVIARNANGILEIDVIDLGEGFDSEVLKHLFKLFVRDNSSSDQGSGLSLALIRLITEAHGGSVSVSNNEIGSTVRISFKDLSGQSLATVEELVGGNSFPR